MIQKIIPVSAIIATKDRPIFLKRTLESIAGQSVLPAEVIVVDGSDTKQSQLIYEALGVQPFSLVFVKAMHLGAATQRLQGIELAIHDFIWFVDDDIVLDPNCTERLWGAFESFPATGAVNAMIINQRYTKPGKLTRLMYRLMDGRPCLSYAGRLIGPAWNLLPEDDPELAEYVPCEWLNTTCTMYRKSAFPVPVFDHFFTGYSMMEDVAVSAVISRNHLLLNARTARIFHDSQPGAHKNNVRLISEMALVNRYFVMTRILGRQGFAYILKLYLLEVFGLVTSLRGWRAWMALPQVVIGKIIGTYRIIVM